jgi:cation diffusion facilitator CzcD-associated flavoprotein CzcO/pimeloyl-ACP methyl ester carboxylesterase
VTPAASGSGRATRTPRVAIVGGGVSGIGIAAKLKLAGIDLFDLYEQADDLGGTWRANSYPGLEVDVPARYYQYRFAPNPDWSRLFCSGREILAYLERVAREFGVYDHASLRTRVTEAEWTGEEWLARTDDGREKAYDFILAGTGLLVYPRIPELRGLETFAGAWFHSAEWDHSVALEGKRIGVIGSGATGVQAVKGLADVAGHLELYQRTPHWIWPFINFNYGPQTKWLYRHLPWLTPLAYHFWRILFEGSLGRTVTRPGVMRFLMTAMTRLHLLRIRDPELRRRFTPPPEIEPFCKRIIMATGFYELFERRPNVELVDVGIDRIEPRGIVTADGALHELDVIALATGFHAHEYLRPMELIGPGGMRLSELWDGQEPFAYRSVALPGFPNILMMIGPHSPYGSNSLMSISETQQDFALKLIEMWRRREFHAIAPTHEATDRFNAARRRAYGGTTWASGCHGYYIGKDGLPAIWPWPPKTLRRALANLVPAHWEEVQPSPATAPAGTSLDGARGVRSRADSDGGERLLLVHPAYVTRCAWAPTLPYLKRSFEVLAPTLAGHIGGPRLPVGSRAGVASLVDGLERELDAAGWETSHVAGCSYGGLLALELARRGRARSVFAIAPGGDFRRLGTVAAGRIALVLAVNRAAGRLLVAHTERLCASALGRRLLFRQISAHPSRLDPAQAAHLFRAAAECPAYLDILWASLHDEPPALDRVNCPVLLAWPARDRLLPFGLYGRPLRRAFPAATLCRLKGVGHFAMLDDPRRVAALVCDFAARAEDSRRAAAVTRSSNLRAAGNTLGRWCALEA